MLLFWIAPLVKMRRPFQGCTRSVIMIHLWVVAVFLVKPYTTHSTWQINFNNIVSASDYRLILLAVNDGRLLSALIIWGIFVSLWRFIYDQIRPILRHRGSIIALKIILVVSVDGGGGVWLAIRLGALDAQHADSFLLKYWRLVLLANLFEYRGLDLQETYGHADPTLRRMPQLLIFVRLGDHGIDIRCAAWEISLDFGIRLCECQCVGAILILIFIFFFDKRIN